MLILSFLLCSASAKSPEACSHTFQIQMSWKTSVCGSSVKVIWPITATEKAEGIGFAELCPHSALNSNFFPLQERTKHFLTR